MFDKRRVSEEPGRPLGQYANMSSRWFTKLCHLNLDGLGSNFTNRLSSRLSVSLLAKPVGEISFAS